MHSSNGLYQYQAPSTLDKEESFAVSADKLIAAIRASGEKAVFDTTKDFLRIRNGPFTVRVRKLPAEREVERIAMSKKAAKQFCPDLVPVLKKVVPFMSSDASRPWSVAVLIDRGFAWATNNLSLVRHPIALDWENAALPAQAVNFLCSFDALDHWEVDEQSRMIFSRGKALIRFPKAKAQWPQLDKFFAGAPKKLPPVAKELSDAALQVSKFADRFISVDDKKVASIEQAIETEYELSGKNKGKYSAALLNLILSHATHIDFSPYPKPIHFRGGDLQGVAMGVAPT